MAFPGRLSALLFTAWPAPIGRPLRALALTVLGIALGAVIRPAAAAEPSPTTPLPAGTLEWHELELAAPEVAIEAYLRHFQERRWTVRLPSRSAFLSATLDLELRLPLRDALFDPARWSPAPNGNGFVITPPRELLLQLRPAERRDLYRLLARWPANTPERWPLVIDGPADFDRWAAAGVSSALLERARTLCYPFAGGLALSDISVLAAEFPADDLRAFLRAVSTVRTTLPRLRIRTAVSTAEVLSYWTVEGRNPFALPLLEALVEADTSEDVDLLSIMPAVPRRLAFDLDPDEVRHDIATTSYRIAATLAAPPGDWPSPKAFLDWFERVFPPGTGPARYGDVLELTSESAEPVLPYACAYVGADHVFARDPVGLGLWRFLRLEDLQRRNPHFTDCDWLIRRYRPAPANRP